MKFHFFSVVLSIVSTLLVAMPLRAAEASLSVPARGIIVYSDAWTQDNSPVGVYEIPTSGNSATFNLLGKPANCVGNAGTFTVNGNIFVANAEGTGTSRSVDYYTLDAETFEVTGMGVLPYTFFAYSMVQDPSTGNCYGSFCNMKNESVYFGSINLTNFSTKVIKTYSDGLHFNAMAATKSGDLYGITMGGDLYAIDKNNGDTTLVATTGIVTQYVSSGAVNPRNGKFYYATCLEQGSALYEIDLPSGTVAKVYDIPNNEEIQGMYFPSLSSDDAPDYPSDVNIVFPGTSLIGNLSFTMPSTSVDGTPITGDASYTVWLDDYVIANGTAAYGSNVSLEVEVDDPGMHTFNVAATNDAGQGLRTTTHIFAGADTPLPVAEVTLTYADGVCHLAWAAAQSANGGYLDNLTYNVTRVSDGVLVAEGITETSFSEEFAAQDGQIAVASYAVTATASGTTTAPTMSNSITLGHIVPPYKNSLTTASDASQFTIFNRNGDANTWIWDKRGYMGCYYDNRHSAADDLMVLPAALLQQGSIYTLSFDAYGFETSRYEERVAVYVATQCSPDAFTECLLQPVAITGNANLRLSANFKAPATGEYYFAIHACSEADQFVLYVDNIELSAPLSVVAPGPVTGFKAAPEAFGDLKATLSFTAPTVDMEGNELEQLKGVHLLSGGSLLRDVACLPGQNVEVEVEVASRGDVSFEAVPYNDSGYGELVMTKAFIGHTIPATPTGVAVRPGESFGSVVISWDEVTTDTNGLHFADGDISYTVALYLYREPYVLGENIKGCEFTADLYDEDVDQELLQFAVYAISSEGAEGAGALSDMVPVGMPDELPFEESFPGGYMSHTFGMSYDGAEWWLSTEADMENNVPAQDADDGFAVLGSNELFTSARLFTGRIDLTNAVKPVLKFYYYVLAEADENSIQISINDGSGWVNHEAPVIAGHKDVHTWQEATLDLSPWKGKYVQICFKGTINTYAYIFIDNVRVFDLEAGVAIVENDASFEVTALPGAINIAMYTSRLFVVSDMQGRVVATGNGSQSVNVAPGLYIVAVEGASHVKLRVP